MSTGIVGFSKATRAWIPSPRCAAMWKAVERRRTANEPLAGKLRLFGIRKRIASAAQPILHVVYVERGIPVEEVV